MNTDVSDVYWKYLDCLTTVTSHLLSFCQKEAVFRE